MSDVDTSQVSLLVEVSLGKIGFLGSAQSGWSSSMQINSTAAEVTNSLQALLFVGPADFNVLSGGVIAATLEAVDQYQPQNVVAASRATVSIILHPIDDAPVFAAPRVPCVVNRESLTTTVTVAVCLRQALRTIRTVALSVSARASEAPTPGTSAGMWTRCGSRNS